jgi:hypothetical protein
MAQSGGIPALDGNQGTDLTDWLIWGLALECGAHSADRCPLDVVDRDSTTSQAL